MSGAAGGAARSAATDGGPAGDGPAGAFVVGPGLLAAGSGEGALVGRTVVVKDVIAVEGLPTRLGTLDLDASPEPHHAAVVRALLDAGADVVGTTVTDEIAWSLFGTNPHWGTPANTAVPGAVPGGSSAGSAAAVAAGAADIGIGTDTGGSIRVPAAWCGLVGFRPTHARVDVAGVTGLAPSFDTVGWLVRDDALAATVGAVLLGGTPREVPDPTRVLVARDLLALADEDVARGVAHRAAALAAELGVATEDVEVTATVGGPDGAAEVFRTIQGREALALHGAWLATGPRLGRGVAARVEAARSIGRHRFDDALGRRADLLTELDALGRDAVVVAPSAPVAAPTPAQLAADTGMRGRVLATTATASLWGAPVLARPIPGVAGAGWSLMGAPGCDEGLLALAAVPG